MVVLVTGMSGTGKSSVLLELGRRGHRVVDTDEGGYAIEVPVEHGAGLQQLWRVEAVDELLAAHAEGALFVAGCVSNQGRFYDRFDVVALLSAPLDVILIRAAARTTNPFGRTRADRQRIVADTMQVEPLLRATSTLEIDTRLPLAQVADRLEQALVRPTGLRRGGPDADQPPDA